MKKINLLLFAAVVFLAASSCKKEHQTITQTINVNLKLNASYSYTVPQAGDADDVMQITQQAMHSSVSKVTPDADGNVLFEYVPAKDFSGTDEVRISNVEEHGGGHHGNCDGGNHGHGDTNIYIFKINISSTR